MKQILIIEDDASIAPADAAAVLAEILLYRLLDFGRSYDQIADMLVGYGQRLRDKAVEDGAAILRAVGQQGLPVSRSDERVTVTETQTKDTAYVIEMPGGEGRPTRKLYASGALPALEA